MEAQQQRRLRVFAGPNGSGKSTVIEYIRKYRANNKPLDFGYYVNADDIGQALKSTKGFSFSQFDFQINQQEFEATANESGLIKEDFKFDTFINSFKLKGNSVECITHRHREKLAQVVADFIRKKLLSQDKRFSFETVFSHTSKLEIMRQAAARGYKVYLYFVSTESPEINKFRVEARTKKGGHDVPVEKIFSRYKRSLDFLHEAAQLAYQTFFFDNSETDQEFKMFAHFKVVAGKKEWDEINPEDVPNWFKIYYSDKVKGTPAS